MAQEPLSAADDPRHRRRLIERDGVDDIHHARASPKNSASRSPRSTGMSGAGTNSSTVWSIDCSARWPIYRSTATTPVERIASLARSQRRALIDRQHLLAIAHERDRTPTLFLPIQQRLAAMLAELGVTGTDAALILRAVQVHVISSAVMQFSAVRGAKHEEEDPSLWDDEWPDQALVQALQSPTDYDAVFEYGLSALLATLPG